MSGIFLKVRRVPFFILGLTRAEQNLLVTLLCYILVEAITLKRAKKEILPLSSVKIETGDWASGVYLWKANGINTGLNGKLSILKMANTNMITRHVVVAMCLVTCLTISAQRFSNLYYDNRPSMLFGSIEMQHNNYYVTGVTAFQVGPNQYYAKAMFGKATDTGMSYSIGIIDSNNSHYELFNNCLHFSSDGNLVAVGSLVDTTYKVFLLKTDTDGNVLLWREYPRNDVAIFHGQDVIEISGHGYILAINAAFTNGNSRSIIIRTDTLGNILNEKIYGVGSREAPWVIRKTLKGSFMISGSTSKPTGFTPYWCQSWLMEVDSMGEMVQQWLDSDVTNLRPLGMQQTADSGWILVRQHLAYDEDDYQAFNASILKLDKHFNKEWNIDTGDASPEAGMYDVEVLPDGKYIVCGTTPISGHDSAYRFGWIMKIDTSGSILWDKKYIAQERFGTHSFLNDIDILPNGDLLACGEMQYTFDLGLRPAQQGWILRTDSNGCVLDNCLVGISDNALQNIDYVQMHVYPNPFTTDVSIALTGAHLSTVTYTIINNIGQIVCKQTEVNVATGYTKMLDLTYLPNGFYFVEVATNEGKQVEMIVKQ